jgi:hypothetical protein
VCTEGAALDFHYESLGEVCRNQRIRQVNSTS